MKSCHKRRKALRQFGVIFAIFLSLFCGADAVGATGTFTFDDLDQGTPVPVPNGYAGLQWSNFWQCDYQFAGVSGMSNSVISPRRVAFNANGNNASMSASTTFNVASTYLTGVWNDGLNVEIKGFNGATLLYDHTYTINSTAPSLINLNYSGVTSIDFLPSGGVNHGWPAVGNGGAGPVFAMDNLVLTSVPEPSHIALMGIGLLCLLAKRMTKRG